MHIVIDAHLAVKEIDGIARYLVGLLSALPALDSSIRYTYLVLPADKSGLPESLFAPGNVHRYELDLMGPSPRQHLIMGRLLRKLKADLYHHPQYDLPIALDLPTVITVHDLKYIFHPQFLSGKNRLKHFYIKQSLRYSVRHSQNVIAVSANTRKDLVGFLPNESHKITVIHHGVSEPQPALSSNGVFGNSLPKQYILVVGTRRPHKNLEGLVQMLAILRQRKKMKIELVIAGKGYAGYRGPEQVAGKLGLAKFTHFLDFVAEENLPALYAGASLVAMPSFYEGFGLPVVEAMAFGCPVIGANISSIPEVLGDAGLLFDPYSPEDMAEKAYKILTDKQLAEAYSNKARARAKLFSWETVAEKTLAIYRSAAAV